MKPDFKALFINEIDISGEIALTAEILDSIRKASPPDEDGDFGFYDSYKVGRNSYIAWMYLSEPSQDNRTSKFGLHYESGRGGRLRKSLPRIREAIEILSTIDNPIELSSICKFEFGKRNRVNTLINLPLIWSESPNLPFDKIEGMHFSRSEDKRFKYHVILDRSEDGSLSEVVIFQHEVKIDEQLVDKFIKEAITIANKFVLREK